MNVCYNKYAVSDATTSNGFKCSSCDFSNLTLKDINYCPICGNKIITSESYFDLTKIGQQEKNAAESFINKHIGMWERDCTVTAIEDGPFDFVIISAGHLDFVDIVSDPSNKIKPEGSKTKTEFEHAIDDYFENNPSDVAELGYYVVNFRTMFNDTDAALVQWIPIVFRPEE